MVTLGASDCFLLVNCETVVHVWGLDTDLDTSQEEGRDSIRDKGSTI